MNKTNIGNLVLQAKEGKKSAIEELYSSCWDELYFFVLKNVKLKEAAEDITQEAFLVSFKKIADLKDPSKYQSWLYSIAYKECLKFFKSDKHIAEFESDELAEQAMEATALNEPVMVPDDYAENRQTRQQLREIIDDLKPDMRSAIILYYYDNLNIEDVARTMGIKENAVKQKLFRARKKIKTKVEALAKSGAVLCAVPLNHMLKDCISPKYVAAVKSSTAATASTAMLTKVAGACAACAACAAAVIPVCAVVLTTGGNVSQLGNYADSSIVRSSSKETFGENSSAEDNSSLIGVKNNTKLNNDSNKKAKTPAGKTGKTAANAPQNSNAYNNNSNNTAAVPVNNKPKVTAKTASKTVKPIQAKNYSLNSYVNIVKQRAVDINNISNLLYGNISYDEKDIHVENCEKDPYSGYSGEIEYARVTDANYKTTADIRKFLNNTVAQNWISIYKGMLDTDFPRYKDYNGHLYVDITRKSGGGATIVDTINIKDITNNSFRAEGTRPDGTYEMKFVKENGIWKIAQNSFFTNGQN